MEKIKILLLNHLVNLIKEYHVVELAHSIVSINNFALISVEVILLSSPLNLSISGNICFWGSSGGSNWLLTVLQSSTEALNPAQTLTACNWIFIWVRLVHGISVPSPCPAKLVLVHTSSFRISDWNIITGELKCIGNACKMSIVRHFKATNWTKFWVLVS